MTKETVSADALQGQLIATHVLLEAILQSFPRQALVAIEGATTKIGKEIAGQLLATAASDRTLDEFQKQIENQREMLRLLMREATFRAARSAAD